MPTDNVEPEPTNDRQIKVHPLLGREAGRIGADYAYRIWCILRNAKAHGYQWHTRNDVIETLALYGMSRSHWYTILKDPHFPTFFTINKWKDTIYPRSLEKVCLDLETLPGTAVWIDGKKAHKLHTFNGAVYASRYGDKPVFIARSTIEKDTGVPRARQRRYEKAEGVEVKQNYEKRDITFQGNLPMPEGMREATGWNFTRIIEGKIVFFWQTVNSYTNDGQRAARGMARKVSRRVRGTLLWAERERRQSYFLDFSGKTTKPYIRGTKTLRTGSYADKHPVKRGGHSIAGDLWESVTI